MWCGKLPVTKFGKEFSVSLHASLKSFQGPESNYVSWEECIEKHSFKVKSSDDLQGATKIISLQPRFCWNICGGKDPGTGSIPGFIWGCMAATCVIGTSGFVKSLNNAKTN